jgi:hypothetical protein
MSRRELKSAERRIPTLNESRSFGRGKSVPFDTLAIAMERKCVLLTDNHKDFPMPEVKLYPLPEGY